VAEPVIAVREISKLYRIGEHQLKGVPAVSTRRILARLLGRRPPPAKGERKFLALDRVSFDVMPGDRIGIVGRNGAGKSTLLKVLSRVVPPTSGEATIRGRLTSLLEVGTGFNDALTGRDNVYLNASLHGLSTEEIAARYDEIVAFSEIGEFIDTPVNHYSSGMRARLAFAVAAHLDPDIMMLDEVLAVGDLAFQRKCLARMDSIMEGGRALLFVSHSIDDIRRYCDKAIWLDKGRLVMSGSAAEVTEAYAESSLKLQSSVAAPAREKPAEAPAAGSAPKTSSAFDSEPSAHLLGARVLTASGATASLFSLDESVVIEFDFAVDRPGLYVPFVHVATTAGIRIFVSVPTDTALERQVAAPGSYRTRVTVPPHFLNVGTHQVTIGVTDPTVAPLKRHFQLERALSFHMGEAPDGIASARGLMPREFPGVVRPMLDWRTAPLDHAAGTPAELQESGNAPDASQASPVEHVARTEDAAADGPHVRPAEPEAVRPSASDDAARVESSPRLVALDGLRGLAALNVLLSHAFFAFLPWLMASTYPAAQEAFPDAPGGLGFLEDFAPTVFFNGFFAVAVFFAISGMVLSNGATPTDQGRRLVLRRTLGRYPRLMLPVLASVLISLVLLAAGAYLAVPETARLSGSSWFAERFQFSPDVWSALQQGLVGALFYGADSYNPPLWSLRPEMLGSLMLFAFLMVLPSTALRLVGGVLVLPFMALSFDPQLALLAGLMIASAAILPMLHRDRPLLGIALIVVGLVLGNYNDGAAMGWLRDLWRPFAGALGFAERPRELANVFGGLALVAGVLLSPGARGLLSGSRMRWFGKQTFGIYLLHFPVIASLGAFAFVATGGNLASALIAILASLVVTIGVAALFTQWVDRPAIRAGHWIGKAVHR
jgi:lipopolysaccharide transport system ATP-binding protein